MARSNRRPDMQCSALPFGRTASAAASRSELKTAEDEFNDPKRTSFELHLEAKAKFGWSAEA